MLGLHESKYVVMFAALSCMCTVSGHSQCLPACACVCAPQSKSWRHCVGRTVELVQVQRQADQQFIALLQSIRVGR